MIINSLHFWLSSVLSLLINIDQETILNFLNIEDPFTNEEYNTLLGAVNVSTPVSLETFKLIIQSIWEHYRHGLGFVDIENIAVFILIVRFLFLSRKYNIKTSFFITCIGLSASYLWYMHLRDLAFYYMRTLWMCPLTHNLSEEFEEIYYQQLAVFSRAGARFDSQSFYGPALRALQNMTSDTEYRFDPLSMLWTYLPTDIKYLTDKIYYVLTLKVIPSTYKFIDFQMIGLSSMLWYTFIVRINKRYCPYLLRWHWTFLLTLEYLERPFIYIQDRSVYYLNEILLPNGYFIEASFVTNFVITIVAAQYLFIVLALLHALCGQYFYFPFLTENTELHVGLRPKDSIYSGGYTIWQNKRAYMVSRQASAKLRKYRFGTIRAAYSKLPRFWYGWLGRGTVNDLTMEEYKQYLKDKENKNSIKRARRRNSKIRWEYRQERLKKRIAKILAKFGIKINSINIDDDDDDFYEEFRKISKK